MNLEKFYIKPEEVDRFTVLYEILQHARTRYPERTAYRQIESKTEISDVTFAQIGKDVDALRASLLARGYKGRHIALIGEASIEWITAYLAITSGVGVCIPIDKEMTPETIAKQLENADTELILFSVKMLKKMQKVLPLCESINNVVVMRAESVQTEDDSKTVVPLTQLISEGHLLLEKNGSNALPEKIEPDETCVIIYTSGTTGANKGVMLSNRNIMGTLRGCARLLRFPSTSISVLPINHSYELHAHIMSCLYCGTMVCFNDDLKHLLKNLERYSPEMSCMVPVMLDLIVRKLKKQISDSGKEATFYRTVKLSNALRRVHIDLRRQLFSQILNPLGGKLRMIICGGAALSQDTVDFLSNIGIQVFNGYGITECSPVAAVNPSSKVRRYSVGHVLPTMKVRISEPDENGNGEIQLSGDNVMKGYYKMPEDTEKVFTSDGWFKTGDIGHVDKYNFLYINGRIKNLIILSNGKNVFPEELENELMDKVPCIKECVVYADEAGTGLYALCYLDRDFCKAHELNTPEEAKAYIREDIKAFNSNEPGYKKLADYYITETEFEKSTTHKILRFKIAALVQSKERKLNV